MHPSARQPPPSFLHAFTRAQCFTSMRRPTSPADLSAAPSHSNSSQSLPLLPNPTSRRWGEKGVRGEGKVSFPSPQTSRGNNLTRPSRQPAAAPKSEGKRCRPPPDSKESVDQARRVASEPGPWPRSAAHSPEAAMLGEGERTQRTRMRRSHDYSERVRLGDEKLGGGGELSRDTRGGAALL